MKKILIASSLNYDYIMDYKGSFADHIIPEKIKTLSVSFPIYNLSKNFGGNGGNFAYTLSLLGETTSVITAVGNADFDPYREHLERHNIDTSHLHYVEGQLNSQCFLMTDKLHCQIIAMYFGPLLEAEKLSLRTIKDLTSYGFMIIATSTPKAIHNFSVDAQKYQLPYLYAPGQEMTRMENNQLREGIKGADVVVNNDYELALMMRETGMSKKDILSRTRVLITTFGAKGSVIETKDEKIEIGIAPARTIVDPTGAGDAYIAGFTAGYVNKLPLKTCGQMGSLTAAYAIEHYGTQKHSFTHEDFKKRYFDAFGEHLSL